MRRLSLGLLIVVAGCATAPVRLTGVAGPVAWHVTDFQLATNTVRGQPRKHYAFTLLLQEMVGAGITFTGITQVVSGVHIITTSAAQAGSWRLEPRGELRLPLWLLWSCPEAGEDCSAVAGQPHWHISLAGTDDHGQSVQLVIDLDAPASEIVVAEARAVSRFHVTTGRSFP
jgi:hypothetical protein